jgi:hypothetical protein
VNGLIEERKQYGVEVFSLNYSQLSAASRRLRFLKS